MQLGKTLAIAALVYVAVVAVFETVLGALQPTPGSTLVITTFDGGAARDRVLTRLESDGKLYVAANHWPRAWYRRALANPEVRATIDGTTAAYRAVPVTGPEHDRIAAEHPLPLPFRIVTGFPPRYFVRLEPRDDAS